MLRSANMKLRKWYLNQGDIIDSISSKLTESLTKIDEYELGKSLDVRSSFRVNFTDSSTIKNRLLFSQIAFYGQFNLLSSVVVVAKLLM